MDRARCEMDAACPAWFGAAADSADLADELHHNSQRQQRVDQRAQLDKAERDGQNDDERQ